MARAGDVLENPATGERAIEGLEPYAQRLSQPERVPA
jgi:hypothetical protein